MKWCLNWQMHPPKETGLLEVYHCWPFHMGGTWQLMLTLKHGMMAACEASHSGASSGSLYCNLNICFWREIIGNYGRVDCPRGVWEYYYLQPFALSRHPVAVDFYFMRNVEFWCGAWARESTSGRSMNIM